MEPKRSRNEAQRAATYKKKKRNINRCFLLIKKTKKNNKKKINLKYLPPRIALEPPKWSRNGAETKPKEPPHT